MILVGCNSENNSLENDLKKENLKGDVKYVQYMREPLCIDPDIEFDDNGFVIKKVTSVPRYDIYEESECFYEEGRIVKGIYVGGEPIAKYLKFYTVTYKYGDNGKLSEILHEGDNGYKFVTNFKYKNDLLEETVENSPVSVDKTTFHYTNNQIDSIICLRKDIEDNLISRKSQYFNSKGQEFKTILPYNEGTILRDFNESNLIIKEVYNLQDGVSEIKYTYEFDDNRNWIKKYSNGKLEKERKIYYKGDDYTDIKNKIEKDKSNFLGNDKKSSINNSQTESNDNSSSNSYQEPERQQQPEKVKCYSCRGSGDCGKCSKTFSKPYYQGNGSYKWRNETKHGYTMCQDCFGRGHKQSHVVGGSGWEPNGDCYVGGCEDGWVNCRECNGSGNGTLLGKCSDCKGTGYRN